MSFSKRPPNKVTAWLKKRGIDAETILASVETDLDLTCAFCSCFLILTKEELLLLSYAPQEYKTYPGYPCTEQQHSLPHAESRGEPVLRRFLLSRCQKLDIVPLIAGGVIYLKVDENETELSAFTNGHMQDVRHFITIFQKVLQNEELLAEDFQNKKEDDLFCPKCGTAYPEKDRKICPKCMDKRSVFFRMLSYFKPHTGKLIVMMILFVLSSAISVLLPYLTGKVLYDDLLGRNIEFAQQFGFGAGDFFLLLFLAVAFMLFVKIMEQVLGMIKGVLVAKVVPDVVYRIKSDVFRAMRRLTVGFYSNRQTGSLMVRVLGDAQEVTGFFIDGLPFFIGNLLSILIVVIVMFLFNWKMALMTIILLPLLAFVSVKLQPVLFNLHGKRHRANRNLNANLNDNLTGARVVKAFGQEKTSHKLFSKRNLHVREAEISIVKVENQYSALYSAVENIMSLLVWMIGAILILRSGGVEMTYGVLSSFVAYIGYLSGPLDFMSYIFRWWVNSINAGQRIFEIIDAVPDLCEKHDAHDLGTAKGDVCFEHVTFGYEPNKNALTDISLQVKPGKMLGIVGHSGAGKSTLVNLLSRLYDPDEGTITIDGYNVKDLTFASLRRNIAMVSQETYIFMGTVAENIAYARPNATHKEIIAAARAASAHDFICKMPDGYDTIIGSGGQQLSGGERQRISIARAILANPRILILDEATASVDTETERSIQDSLDRLVKGRTTISIAHRLSTLRAADDLVVIEDGKITERGTHEELYAMKGTYYKLVELQSKALALKGATQNA